MSRAAFRLWKPSVSTAVATVVLVSLATDTFAQTATTRTVPATRVRSAGNIAIPIQDIDAAKQQALIQAQLAAQGIDGAIPGEVAPPENPRLDALMQLTFDRRSSAILKAWANLDEAGKETTTADDDLPPRPPDAADWTGYAQAFARNVLKGEWDAVRETLKALPEEDGKQVYLHMVRGLSTLPPQLQAQAANMPSNVRPKQILSPNDVLAIIDCSPTPLEKETITPLAQLLRSAASLGSDLENLVTTLDQGTELIGGEDPEKRILAGRLLMSSGQSDDAGKFLPLEKPLTEIEDAETLDLLVSFYWSQFQKDGPADLLKKTWDSVQAILALGDHESLTPALRQKSITKAIELVPMIEEAVGQAWLAESFVKFQNRGKEILASIGSVAADNLVQRIQDQNGRLKTLRLQNTAVQALLASTDQVDESWRPTLDLLAINWLNEAQISKTYAYNTGGRPRMQRDVYGNFYYINDNDFRMQQARNNSRQPIPIQVADLLDVAPDETMMALINDEMKASFNKVFAELHLKISQESDAFPYIEMIAESDPESARNLVHEFLRTWARNHNPNTDRQQRNPYVFIYGFEMRADGIPLTRSKQERNLRELQDWIARIRKLPIEPPEERYLADAFTACHSSAEVYQLDAFEKVFGSIESLEPETIAGIAEKMRSNLVENWRVVRNQEAKQTNRKEKDVQREVLLGYTVARALIETALTTNPDNWRLQLALASLMHDENDYAQSITKSSEYSDRRKAAFQQFAKATEAYATIAGDLKTEERSIDVFTRWFYASLGACDLGQISHENNPAVKQYDLVRKAIDSLPGELGQWHLDQFANNLFTRMSPLKPAVKFRYLKGGFAIVGEHPRAWEAKQVFDYYSDLVTEINLVTEIDGPDTVGHMEPFGIFVKLRHTPEIERESAGFSKYVVNQNNMLYAYNYGRPTENYREKFEDSVHAALSEHFEVINVVFEGEKTMKSRDSVEEGWRITPYAYVVLKARGPEVDTVPSVKLDLDFLDTSGYAVLPIESSPIRIDATSPDAPTRSVDELQVTQTLDERQAGEGKLILEITAKSIGLVPSLEQIVDLKVPGFEVTNVGDQGVIASEFDSESDDIQIRSDRSWIVELAVSKAAKQRPEEFQFCSAKLPESSMTFQRYEDADLVATPAMITLEETYEAKGNAWLPWILAGTAGGFALVLIAVLILVTRKREQPVDRFQMPEDINPFSVIGLLRRIHAENGFQQAELAELGDSIEKLENHYFGQRQGEQPDLVAVAETWIRKAK